MAEMTLQRIPFTIENDNRMRSLKAKTGVTPNLLGRFGFCISLEEPGIPKKINLDDEMGREINRYTMLGEYDEMFIALLKTWMINHDIDYNNSENMNNYFVDHMNRGFENIFSRMKTIADLERLIPKK